jgi:hypothetical protein
MKELFIQNSAFNGSWAESRLANLKEAPKAEPQIGEGQPKGEPMSIGDPKQKSREATEKFGSNLDLNLEKKLFTPQFRKEPQEKNEKEKNEKEKIKEKLMNLINKLPSEARDTFAKGFADAGGDKMTEQSMTDYLAMVSGTVNDYRKTLDSRRIQSDPGELVRKFIQKKGGESLKAVADRRQE